MSSTQLADGRASSSSAKAVPPDYPRVMLISWQSSARKFDSSQLEFVVLYTNSNNFRQSGNYLLYKLGIAVFLTRRL